MPFFFHFKSPEKRNEVFNLLNNFWKIEIQDISDKKETYEKIVPNTPENILCENLRILGEWKVNDSKRLIEWDKYLATISNGSSKTNRISKWDELPCDTVLIHENKWELMIRGGIPNVLRRFIWLQSSDVPMKIPMPVLI